MNAVVKIALEPLEFDEFATLDALVGAEIAERYYRVRTQGDGHRAVLDRLISIRARLDRARCQVPA